VVISAFNEEDNLQELYAELTRVMSGLGISYELLFVDDGSTDRSFELLRRFHDSDQHVRVIRFARNFGQQAANAAGLRLARGKSILLIDADLQTPPSEIPKLRAKLLEGHDVVYGVRRHRPVPFYRRMGTIVVNWFLRKVTGVNVPDAATSFLAIDRKLVDEVNLLNEKTRYLCGYLAWLSYGRYAAIPVEHVPRKHGQSKYTLWRLIELTLTLIIHYSNAPLALAFSLGLALIVGGAATLIWALASAGKGFTETLMGTVIILAGVQLVCLGILGEYIGRIYNETRDRPPYVIREVLDHGTRDLNAPVGAPTNALERS
jgi:dolichol-phosphate mannosyltransferase